MMREDNSVDVVSLLRHGASEEKIRRAFQDATAEMGKSPFVMSPTIARTKPPNAHNHTMAQRAPSDLLSVGKAEKINQRT
jgi:hypothetical protein